MSSRCCKLPARDVWASRSLAPPSPALSPRPIDSCLDTFSRRVHDGRAPRAADIPCCERAGHDSEVYLVPQRIYKDPFRGGDNIIVIADTYEPPRLQSDGSLSELKVRAARPGVAACTRCSTVPWAASCKGCGVMKDSMWHGID